MRCRNLAIRSLIATVLIIVIFVVAVIHSHNARPHEPIISIPENQTVRYNSPRASERILPTYCDAFDLSKIAISIKTGATEALAKIPMQLMTSLRCVADPMIFSDLNQTIGTHQVHDVLSRVVTNEMRGNDEFALYYKQKELVSQAREDELKTVGGVAVHTNDWRTEGKSAAWLLDKYKFLHMVDRAWELQPGRDWYVFIEADTYLSLLNLVRWLSTLNPKEKLYLGNSMRMWEHPTEIYFAHGGSGFVLSGATVQDFAVTHEGIPQRFDGRVKNWWYGDFILADALEEECNVRVTDVTPMVNDNEPELTPFQESVWCQPIVTSHHVDSERFDSMYRFERAHNFTNLLFRDIFEITYAAGLPSRRDNWDNFSGDPRFEVEVYPNDPAGMPDGGDTEELLDPNRSFEACKIACSQSDECFQFSFLDSIVRKENGEVDHAKKCLLSTVFRLGRDANLNSEPETQWTSGWRSDKIAQWIEDHKNCSSAWPV